MCPTFMCTIPQRQYCDFHDINFQSGLQTTIDTSLRHLNTLFDLSPSQNHQLFVTRSDEHMN